LHYAALLLTFCFCAGYYKEKVELPDPSAILGPLEEGYRHHPGEGTDFSWDGTPIPCLRETKEHQDFIFLFIKTVMLNKDFKENSHTAFLSDYVHHALEAYAVLLYDNGYDGWLEECQQKEEAEAARALAVPPARLEVGDEENESQNEDTNTDEGKRLRGSKRRKYTANSLGRGKYKGWGDEAVPKLYERLFDKIKEQRSDTNLAAFEKELQSRFRNGVTTRQISAPPPNYRHVSGLNLDEEIEHERQLLEGGEGGLVSGMSSLSAGTTIEYTPNPGSTSSARTSSSGSSRRPAQGSATQGHGRRILAAASSTNRTPLESDDEDHDEDAGSDNEDKGESRSRDVQSDSSQDGDYDHGAVVRGVRNVSQRSVLSGQSRSQPQNDSNGSRARRGARTSKLSSSSSQSGRKRSGNQSRR
jgi:hypothetical protein